MEKLKNIVRTWLPLALIVSAFCSLVYLASQQMLRQGANDPQIQMANDAADLLTGGVGTGSVVPATAVEISRSLAPFVIVFDDSGNVLATSGLLHGQTPTIPAGVLDYTRQNGEDRITWQPEEEVRIAAVVVRVQGSSPGFVLAGRSLREVEVRESQMETFAFGAWVLTLAASLALVILGELFLGEKKR
jgi:hypothetical protein